MAYRPYSRRELDYHHAHGPPGPADAASTNTHNYYNGASNFHRTGPYSLQNRGRQDLEHYSTTSLHPTGSGFSNRDPQSVFRGGRDDYRSRQAAAVQSEQFHQDTDIHNYSQDFYREPLNSYGRSLSEDSLPAFDYREQLSFNPVGSQGSFLSDRGPPKWEHSNFSPDPYKPPMMREYSEGSISQTGTTGFDTRPGNHETGSGHPLGQFSGGGSNVLDHKNYASANWQSDCFRAGGTTEPPRRYESGSEGWQSEREYNVTSFRGDRADISGSPSSLRPGDSLLGRYSGKESFLGQRGEDLSQEALYSGARSRGGKGFASGQNFPPMKRKRVRRRRPSNQSLPRRRGRERGKGRGGAFVGQRNVTTPHSQHPHKVSERSGPPKPRRYSSQSERMSRTGDWQSDQGLTEHVTRDGGVGNRQLPVPRKSSGHSTAAVLRSSHDTSRSFDSLKLRSPSPMTIQDRLGPHVPGSGSVQNRLGPPKVRAGVHSRLGPEENSDAHLESMHPPLQPESSLSNPTHLVSESIQYRLGPEDNLSSTLDSTSVHSRLGPEDDSSGPLGSHSFLRGPGEIFTDPLPTENFSSDGIQTYSHCKEDVACNNLPQPDSIRSRLGPEEVFGGSLLSNGDLQPHGGLDNLTGPLGADSLYSRLDPEDNLGREGIHSRLGPEISPTDSHRKPHSIFPSDPVIDFPENSRQPATPMDESLYQRGLYVSDTMDTQSKSSLDMAEFPSTQASKCSFFSDITSSYRPSSRSPLPDSFPPSDHFPTSLHVPSDDAATGLSQSTTLGLSQEDSLCHRLHSSGTRDSATSTVQKTPRPQLSREDEGEDFPKSREEEGHTVSSGDSNLHSSATGSRIRSETRMKIPLKRQVSPIVRKKITSKLSPSKKSPNQTKKPSPHEDSHREAVTKLSPTTSSVCKGAADVLLVSGTKPCSDNSQLPATATSPGVGQSIPTLLQCKVVTPVTPSTPTLVTPLTPVELTPASQHVQKVPRAVNDSSRKTHEELVPSVSAAYSASMAAIGYNDSSDIGGEDRPKSTGNKQVAVVLSSEPQEELRSAVTSGSLERRQSEDMELDECDEVIVGVASVVTCDREIEEGEVVTDSECEDLVIDLDGSGSSASTPKKNENTKPRGTKSTSSISKPLDKTKPVDKHGHHATTKAGQRSTKVALKDNQETKTAPNEHHETNVPHKVTVVAPKDHQEIKVVPKDSQETDVVPKDHQETKVVTQSAVEGDTKCVDSHPSIKAVVCETSPTCSIGASIHSVSAPTSSDTTLQSKEITVIRPEGKLLKRAAVVLGMPLARDLNGTSAGDSGGGAVLLNVIRCTSAKLSNMLKILFKQPKNRNLNVDVMMAYIQMKLPESAVGTASIMKLAQLAAVNSLVFFRLDLQALFRHCGRDIWKWKQVSVKYSEGACVILRSKGFFPKSVIRTTGDLLSSLVVANIPKQQQASNGGALPTTNAGLSFLEVAKIKYGPSLVQVLNEIDRNICKRHKIGASSESSAVEGGQAEGGQAGSVLRGEIDQPTEEPSLGKQKHSLSPSAGAQIEWSPVRPSVAPLTLNGPKSTSNRELKPESQDLPLRRCVPMSTSPPCTEASLEWGPPAMTQTTQKKSATSTVKLTPPPNLTSAPCAPIIESVTLTSVGSPTVGMESTSQKSSVAPRVSATTGSTLPPSKEAPQSLTGDKLYQPGSTLRAKSDDSTPQEVDSAVGKVSKPAESVGETGSQLPTHHSIEPTPHQEDVPTISMIVNDKQLTEASVDVVIDLTGTSQGSETKTDTTKSKKDLEVDEISVVSISSGEIVSSTPTSPAGQLSEGEDDEFLKHTTRGESSRGFDWSGGRTLPPSPPTRHRVIPQAYKGSSSPPPFWSRRRESGRGQWLDRGGPLGEFTIGSMSRSGSPAARWRRESHSSRYSRRRYSSPEDDSPRHHRRRRRTLSPDVHSGRFGIAYKNWKKSVVKGREREGRGTGRGREGEERGKWQGEGRRRRRRVRSCRSCDRLSDTAESSEEEDLEVLELRKQAIMSMLTDDTAMKAAKSELGSDSRLKEGKMAAYSDAQNVEVATGEEESMRSDKRIRKWSLQELPMTDVSETGIVTEGTEVGGVSYQHKSVEELANIAEDVEMKRKTDTSNETMSQTDGDALEKPTPSVVSVECGKVLPETRKSEVSLMDQQSAISLTVSESNAGRLTPSPSVTKSLTTTATTTTLSTTATTTTLSTTATTTSTPSLKLLTTLPTTTVSTTTTTTTTTLSSTAVVHGVKGKVSTSQTAGGSRRAKSSVTASLKASLPSSGSSSRVGSPASSRGSPAPPLSGVESGAPSRRGSSKPPTCTSVKVMPGSKVTWEIPRFHIQVAGEESDDERNESEIESEPDAAGHRPPTMDEIDSILGLFRRDAEAKAKQKEMPDSSTPSPAPPPPSSKGEPLQSPPEIARVEPEAVGMLPLERQKEYLELKTKLVLHAKKRREGEMAGKSKDKGKQPLNTTASRKAKITCLEQVKPVDNQIIVATVAPTINNDKSVDNEQTAHQKEVLRKNTDIPRDDTLSLETGEQQQRKEKEESRKKEEEEEEERKRREGQRQKRKCEMRIAELEGKIRSCRSETEQWTRTLTSVTHSLTECETEMEEHELKIELLLKQLELAKNSHTRCSQKKLRLQSRVRIAQENISRHAGIIQDTQRLLINERDLLIAMETDGNHGDITDNEMVTMEIESDEGSKGEGDMQIVTSDEDDIGKTPTPFPPLHYEPISDAEGPGSHSSLDTDAGSHVLVPVSDSVMREALGKRRRLSKSERTRKSSLSIVHTATMESVSDSDTEDSGKKVSKKIKPPIPSCPPPLLPPPPTSPHQHTVTPLPDNTSHVHNNIADHLTRPESVADNDRSKQGIMSEPSTLAEDYGGEGTSLSRLVDSISAHNPFLLMLKISKIESLSESSDAFSPTDRRLETKINALPGHMTFPTCHVMSRDIKEASHDQKQPTSAVDCTKLLTSVASVTTTPPTSDCVCPTPCDVVEVNTGVEFSLGNGDSFQTPHDIQQSSVSDTMNPPHLSPSGTSAAGAKTTTNVDEKQKTQLASPQTHVVYITVDESPKLDDTVGPLSVQRVRKVAARSDGKGKRDFKKSAKKEGTVPKTVRQTGNGGRITKSRKKSVGKLPLVRSESDSVVFTAIRKTRRKSIPKRYPSNTASSSPLNDTTTSLIGSGMGAGSSTLFKALQTTLESALSPALAHVLSPSRSPRYCDLLDLQLRENNDVQQHSPVSVSLDKTLQQTMKQALSPALESLLSPSSYCKVLGGGESRATRTDRDVEKSVKVSVVPTTVSKRVFVPPVVSDVGEIGLSCDLGVKSHDQTMSSHDSLRDSGMVSLPANVENDPKFTENQTISPSQPPQEQGGEEKSPVTERRLKPRVTTGVENTSSFLCGPAVPQLGVVPRAIPNIPLEIDSSGVDVQMLRHLVQTRSATVARPGIKTVERVSGSLETCDVETSENERMEVGQSGVETSRSKPSDLKFSEVVPKRSSTPKSASSDDEQRLPTAKQPRKAAVTVAMTSDKKLTSDPTGVRSPSVLSKSVPSKSCQSSTKSGVSRSHSSPSKSKRVTAPHNATTTTVAAKHTKLSKMKEKARSVRSLTPPPPSSSTATTQSLSVDNLLGRIKQVKTNLEKQAARSAAGVKVASVTKQLTANGPQSQTATARAAPLKQQQTVTQLTKSQDNKSVTARKKPSSKKQGMTSSSVRPVGVANSVKPVKKSDRVQKKSTLQNDLKLKSSVQLPQEKAGELLDSTQMESIVRELGFGVTWNELQQLLQPSNTPGTLPTVTTGCHDTNMGNPVLIIDEHSHLDSSAVVSDSVLELVLKQNSQSENQEPVSNKSRSSLRRYKPYTSPLLCLPSYRLSPQYRSHAQIPLSSLSHSNKIDPVKIWCKYEVFGKCDNPKCGGQHLRDIKLSKAEIVDDIVAYSPSLSTDHTAVSDSGTGTSSKTARVSQKSLSEKPSSYGEMLISKYSTKMSDEQLLKLAVHRVGQRSDGGGVVMAEEVKWSGRRDGGTLEDRVTRPPPLYWSVDLNNEPTPHHAILHDNTTTGAEDNSSKVDRYFTTSTSPSVPTSHPPPTPAGPSHFLSLARGAREHGETCDHLEAGLALHPQSEEVWLEYLQKKSTVITGSDCRGDREELLSNALSSCATYAVVTKCIQMAESVSEKERWIKKGYDAITQQTSLDQSSLSLFCVELLLSHTYLHRMSGHLQEAVSSLQFSLDISEKSHIFTGITAHLSLPHLQLSYLTLLHLLYTSVFPQHIVISSHTLPLRLKHDVRSLLLPWSRSWSLSQDKLQRIEQLFAVAITKCQHQDPSNSVETTFALYHNLVLFQLVHRSREIAQQTLNGLLDCSPHSTQLWMLAARLQDRTSGSATPVEIMKKASENKLDSRASELYCFATKLIMKQGEDGCHGDVLTAALPWIRDCVCQFYDVSVSDQHQLNLADITLLYRKLLGQQIPYDYHTPEIVRLDVARVNLPYLWITYCLLVQLSHHTLRGDYHHSDPEEAFESAVHSVNQLSHLQIVWIEYLSYLRDNALKKRCSHGPFKTFSDCVYRCLVVMDTKQATPTSLSGQPKHYHDYSLHEQVCSLYFSCLPPSSPHTLGSLLKLAQKFPDHPHLIARLCQYCLDHSLSSLGLAQSALATYLSQDPKCLHLWSLATLVELALHNTREARWMFHEAVKQFPLSANLWKEFLLFELRNLSTHSPPPSLPPSLSLARDIVTRTAHLGVVLTPLTPSPLSPCHLSPPAQLNSTQHNVTPLQS